MAYMTTCGFYVPDGVKYDAQLGSFVSIKTRERRDDINKAWKKHKEKRDLIFKDYDPWLPLRFQRRRYSEY